MTVLGLFPTNKRIIMGSKEHLRGDSDRITKIP